MKCSKLQANQRTMLDAALNYAARGWLVLPLHSVDNGGCTCGDADCRSPGKHPRLSNGCKGSSCDYYQVSDWWRKWPTANVGLATGTQSGIWALDIDLNFNANGFESLAALCDEHGELPTTVESCTGSGGQHIFFKMSDVKLRNRTGIRPGLDVRATGGFVVSPPSRHSSGGTYRWDEGNGPDEVDLAEAPTWLLDLILSEPSRNGHQHNGVSFDAHSLLLQRAEQYVAKCSGAGEGHRNTNAFRLAGHLACLKDEHGNQLNKTQIHDLVARWNQRNSPALSDTELKKTVNSALSGNGTPRAEKIVTSSGGLSRLIFGTKAATPSHQLQRPIKKFTIDRLIHTYPTMKPVLVEGLLRLGETANVISLTKVGKSWLAYSLALAVATGSKWLDTFETEKGAVIFIDNELHPETLADRIPRVGNRLGIFPAEYSEGQIEIWTLRGDHRSLNELGTEFATIPHGQFSLIVLDSKYRFSTLGVSENDNAAETFIYNQIDHYAEQTGAAIVLIHHSTKGLQSDKRITDVGAGAGAQSRATDCHLILREHEDVDRVVLDCALRSFPPIESLVLRWEYPVWLLDDLADPARLKGKQSRSEVLQQERDREAIGRIIAALVVDEKVTPRQLREKTGLSREKLQRLLDLLVSNQEIAYEKTTVRGNPSREYFIKK